MFLYHMFMTDDSEINSSPHRVLREGLNHQTATIWYSNSGKLFPELTESLRPVNLPKWFDFKAAFRVDLEPHEKPYFRFPVFSEKILVFNFDISSDLFAYLEDKYDGGRGRFVEGLPAREVLMKQYWESMHTLEDYFKHKPFNNPETYIFEPVPVNLIEYIE